MSVWPCDLSPNATQSQTMPAAFNILMMEDSDVVELVSAPSVSSKIRFRHAAAPGEVATKASSMSLANIRES